MSFFRERREWGIAISDSDISIFYSFFVCFVFVFFACFAVRALSDRRIINFSIDKKKNCVISNECNKVLIELRVVQFLSEIILSCDFKSNSRCALVQF